jgi:hypothetical protein
MNKTNPFRKSVYGKKASLIVVFLLAAALLVSMVGMASAEVVGAKTVR